MQHKTLFKLFVLSGIAVSLVGLSANYISKGDPDLADESSTVLGSASISLATDFLSKSDPVALQCSETEASLLGALTDFEVFLLEPVDSYFETHRYMEMQHALVIQVFQGRTDQFSQCR